MDESAFYDIQADQDYDWEKDGNAIEEIEETEMVEQEVDPDSVYGVANPELVSFSDFFFLDFLPPYFPSLFHF